MDTASHRSSLPWTRARHFGKIGVSLGVILIVGVVIAYRMGLGRKGSPPMAPPSVAVLPFNNLGDARNEFFSDGLTDELIDSLGRVSGLRVVARASAFQFKGKALDVRDIGKKLGVRAVLGGSVRESEGQLRITAQLDDTSNGYRLWSQSYDRETKDILRVQREISNAITGSLGATLAAQSPLRLQNLNSGGAVSFQAYQDYPRGRYFWNRNTANGINTAIEFFQKAIQRDPHYPLAYVGLAGCYIETPRHNPITSRELAPRIRDLANRALDLDPTLGEAHLDLAVALASELNWAAAEAEFKLGLELSPGNANGHRLYGSLYLSRVGRLEEALREARIAFDLDPVSLSAAQGVGAGLYEMRRYDEAIGQYERALAMDPNFGLARLGLGRCYLGKGLHTRALAEMEQAHKDLEGDIRATGELVHRPISS